MHNDAADAAVLMRMMVRIMMEDAEQVSESSGVEREDRFGILYEFQFLVEEKNIQIFISRS